MLKVGDKIKCVALGNSQLLQVGKTYTVSELRPMGCIRVREIKDEHSYFVAKLIKTDPFKGNTK